MTTSTLPFGTRLIGQTEKTLNAILERLLDGSGIGEPEWVALTLTLQGAPAPALDGLVARGLVTIGEDGAAAVTSSGRELHGSVLARVTVITERLWGDLSPEDRERAAAVLNTTLARASAELAALDH